MCERFIRVKDCFNNAVFKYYIGYKPKTYRITITKVCPKNIYGYIEELDLNEYSKDILAKEKTYTKVKMLVKTNKDTHELIVPFENSYREALNRLKIDPILVTFYKHIEYLE